MMYELTITVHWWTIAVLCFVVGVFFGKWLFETKQDQPREYPACPSRKHPPGPNPYLGGYQPHAEQHPRNPRPPPKSE